MRIHHKGKRIDADLAHVPSYVDTIDLEKGIVTFEADRRGRRLPSIPITKALYEQLVKPIKDSIPAEPIVSRGRPVPRPIRRNMTRAKLRHAGSNL